MIFEQLSLKVQKRFNGKNLIKGLGEIFDKFLMRAIKLLEGNIYIQIGCTSGVNDLKIVNNRGFQSVVFNKGQKIALIRSLTITPTNYYIKRSHCHLLVAIENNSLEVHIDASTIYHQIFTEFRIHHLMLKILMGNFL